MTPPNPGQMRRNITPAPQRTENRPPRPGPVTAPEHTTAPYTFVPFAPTISARTLWAAHADSDFDPTASFDRVLPGTHSGHIDLTITALSPVHVGPAHQGAPFRWPGPTDAPGRFGIPAYTLRGMVRAYLAALLGGGLGLGDDPMPILERFPVGRTRGQPDSVVERHTVYRKRRGHSATIGRQHVGLLYWDGRSDTARLRECPQFIRPVPNDPDSRKVPSVRWEVVRSDLLTGHQADARVVLHGLRGARIHAVWARVSVGGVPRPVVWSVHPDRDAAIAIARATGPATTGHTTRLRSVSAWSKRGNDNKRHPPEFEGFLTETFELADLESAGRVPCAVPMTFFPTNLANLDERGVATGDARPAANCYLLPDPGTVLTRDRTWMGAANEFLVRDDPETGRLPLHTLVQVLRGPYWKHSTTPAQVSTTGWPVFFDTNADGEVLWLGGSGGFPIRAAHTVADAVANAGGVWASTIAATVEDNDAVIALLGAVSQSAQIAARVEVGHATALDADIAPLSAYEVDSLTPHPQSAHTRLVPDPSTGNSASYSDSEPKYRGRELYWHRGTWSTDLGEQDEQWGQAVKAHRALAEQVTGEARLPEAASKTATSMAPLPAGTTFTARIDVTNLTDAELGAVLFALRLPHEVHDGGEPVFAHKLGGGQPLGLGSVHLTATVRLRTADRYTALAGTGYIDHDGNEFIDAFLDRVGWTAELAPTANVAVPETGRSWPPHVAALLTAARWRDRPAPERTAEMDVARHRFKIPMLEVFDVGDPPVPGQPSERT